MNSDISFDEVKAVIEDYKKFSKGIEDYKIAHYKNKYSRILDITNILIKIKKENERRTASNYNIFKIPKINNFLKKEEALHTPFISNLLNPRGSHGQGNLFYKKFLENIDSSNIYRNKFEPENYSSMFVKREESIPNGRIDILIKNTSNNIFAIAIENKIDADDQKDQLSRYFNYLEESPYRKNFLLVYLTRNKKEPTTYSLPESDSKKYQDNKKLVLMGYKEIKHILSESIKEIEASNLIAVLEQYIKIIERFYND